MVFVAEDEGLDPCRNDVGGGQVVDAVVEDERATAQGWRGSRLVGKNLQLRKRVAVTQKTLSNLVTLRYLI